MNTEIERFEDINIYKRKYNNFKHDSKSKIT